MRDKKRGIVFLRGRRVILRPFEKDDLPTLVRWVNDPAVRDFTGSMHLPKTEAAEQAWLERQKDSTTDVVLLIETNRGVRIGVMGLHQINWKDRTALTGAMIGEKRYWGKGYGTDAKMALLEYAFNTLNLHKLCSEVVAFNERSIRYSLHCGYRKEGVRKAHMFKRGVYWDLIELAIFRDDWLPVWEKYHRKRRIRL